VASYYVRQNGGGAQGPFPEERIAGYIAQGKVRAGMELSADGQRWVPVEEHRIYAAALPAAPPEPVEEVAVISAAPERPARRPARRPRPAPASGGGGKAVLAVVGLLVVGAIALVASKGGSSDPDRTGSTTTGAPQAVQTPPPARQNAESKAEYRARWTRHRRTYWGNGTELNEGVLGGYSDAEVEAKVTEISGRRPDNTQTVSGRRFWYFPCSDGLIQLVWWRELGMWHYEVNDY
jgi:hypothetical protein